MMSALGRYTGLDVERGSRTAGILSASGAAKIRRRQLRRSASGPCAERLAGFKELSLAKRGGPSGVNSDQASQETRD